jgi:hypothetical protein
VNTPSDGYIRKVIILCNRHLAISQPIVCNAFLDIVVNNLVIVDGITLCLLKTVRAVNGKSCKDFE